jgi:hypothetical protein
MQPYLHPLMLKAVNSTWQAVVCMRRPHAMTTSSLNHPVNATVYLHTTMIKAVNSTCTWEDHTPCQFLFWVILLMQHYLLSIMLSRVSNTQSDGMLWLWEDDAMTISILSYLTNARRTSAFFNFEKSQHDRRFCPWENHDTTTPGITDDIFCRWDTTYILHCWKE